MFQSIDPQSLKVIHDEKIRDLERQIAFHRAARAQGAVDEAPAWFALAAQWARVKLFNRAPARQEPCPTVPC